MLLVSIHEVAPGHLSVVRRLRDDLARWGVERVTLLAVPHLHGTEPLVRSPETVRWLRQRADAGDEIALHGYYHRGRRPIQSALDRLRGSLLSAGEAECLSLTDRERPHLLARGKQLLEQLIEREVTGFVAPAWLEPRRFSRDLQDTGFAWHESGLWLERLATGRGRRTRIRGPVIGFASRRGPRRLAALAWAHAMTPIVDGMARAGIAPVRIALHPGDAASPRTMECAGEVVRRFARRHPTLPVSRGLDTWLS